MTTVETITAYLTKMVTENQPLGPEQWLEAAQSINVLLQGEQEKLFELESKIAKTRAQLIEGGKTVAHAKAVIEAIPEYVESRKQKAKIERAIEMIRLSKAQARLSNDVMRSN